jgi:hypothetical protein
MYPFIARIPADHVLQIIRNVRAGDVARGENLKLAGAAVGELGALFTEGFPTLAFGDEGAADMPKTVEECCDLLEPMLATDGGAAQINPMIGMLIAKLIELLLKNLS